MQRHFYVLLLFLIVVDSAAQPIQLTPQTESLNLCPLVSVYADSTGTLPFDQVRQQSFLPHREQEFQFGFSSSVFWFRFTIDPGQQLNQNQWYLLWSDGLRDRVDVYIPQANGTWTILEGGMRAPSERKAYKGMFPLYKLGIFKGQTSVFLVTDVTHNQQKNPRFQAHK